MRERERERERQREENGSGLARERFSCRQSICSVKKIVLLHTRRE